MLWKKPDRVLAQHRPKFVYGEDIEELCQRIRRLFETCVKKVCIRNCLIYRDALKNSVNSDRRFSPKILFDAHESLAGAPPQFSRSEDNMNPRSLVIAITEETEWPAVVYEGQHRMCLLILSDDQIMFLHS